eukprot:TRINITY_DN4086_c0_g1_i1.p2 TRINITY_DN4086_c0_g1~~TRINITY_DN4086_c0_g1_i1.p2  ORF type:complete len:108 (+),score=15.11 TRINITY_DN4086_c0_g1_i1:504-827(+)
MHWLADMHWLAAIMAHWLAAIMALADLIMTLAVPAIMTLTACHHGAGCDCDHHSGSAAIMAQADCDHGTGWLRCWLTARHGCACPMRRGKQCMRHLAHRGKGVRLTG